MNSEPTHTWPSPKNWRKWLDSSIVIPTLIGAGLLLLVILAEGTLLPLFVVPFAAVHAWLLAQAWRYVFPPDEAHKPMRIAWQVSAWLAALTLLAMALSLLAPTIPVVPLAIAVTAIIVTSDVGVAVRTARRRRFTDAFVWRLGLGTALLSLVVPVGIGLELAGGPWSWANGLTVVLGYLLSLIWGFVLYRQGVSGYLDRLKARATWWQLDRLALELVLIPVCILISTYFLSSWAGPVRDSQALLRQFDADCKRAGGNCVDLFGWDSADRQQALDTAYFVGILPLLLSCVSLALGILVQWAYSTWKGRRFALKKKGSPLDLHDTPLFRDRHWGGMLLSRTLLWLGVSFGILAAAGQQGVGQAGSCLVSVSFGIALILTAQMGGLDMSLVPGAIAADNTGKGAMGRRDA